MTDCCFGGSGVGGVGVGGVGVGGVGVGGVGGGGGIFGFSTPVFKALSTRFAGITSNTVELSTFGVGRMKPEQRMATTTSRCVPAAAIKHFFCRRVIKAPGWGVMSTAWY